MVSTPAKIAAQDSAAYLTLNVALNVTRHATAHEFVLKASGMLEYASPSTDLALHGAQTTAYGASNVLSPYYYSQRNKNENNGRCCEGGNNMDVRGMHFSGDPQRNEIEEYYIVVATATQ